VDLHTGRTHQIRVHFQHLGFPVVGDLVYGRRHNARLRETAGCGAPRLMLHARQLALTHPRTGRRMVFEAPLPADFTGRFATAPAALVNESAWRFRLTHFFEAFVAAERLM